MTWLEPHNCYYQHGTPLIHEAPWYVVLYSAARCWDKSKRSCREPVFDCCMMARRSRITRRRPSLQDASHSGCTSSMEYVGPGFSKAKVKTTVSPNNLRRLATAGVVRRWIFEEGFQLLELFSKRSTSNININDSLIIQNMAAKM